MIFLLQDDSAGSGAASELGLPNVGGVFVVLIAGCVMAIFISLLELCWHVGQMTKDKKVRNQSLPNKSKINQFAINDSRFLSGQRFDPR